MNNNDELAAVKMGAADIFMLLIAGAVIVADITVM